MSVHVCVYLCACVCKYVCVYFCVCVYLCTWVYYAFVHVRMYINTHDTKQTLVWKVGYEVELENQERFSSFVFGFF